MWTFETFCMIFELYLLFKGLRALRDKNAPFGIGLFIFCSLHHANYKKKDLNMWRQPGLKNIRDRMSVPPLHFNVTDFHCLDRKDIQK